MRQDLRRMRSLLDQMRTNLGSLPPGPTPLKHQFELEIDMWQTLIDHMENAVQASQAAGDQRGTR